jgi:hypothetical protein
MEQEPYHSAHRVVWIVHDGSSTVGNARPTNFSCAPSAHRHRAAPVRASWLNQIEIYCSQTYNSSQ